MSEFLIPGRVKAGTNHEKFFFPYLLLKWLKARQAWMIEGRVHMFNGFLVSGESFGNNVCLTNITLTFHLSNIPIFGSFDRVCARGLPYYKPWPAYSHQQGYGRNGGFRIPEPPYSQQKTKVGKLLVNM